MSKKIFTFAKAQLSAFLGGVLDYVVMIGCTELLHIHYTVSIIISGIVGAVLNFSLNRYWSFKDHEADKSPVGSQLVKFVFMVAGSVLLKAAGTYLLTNWLKSILSFHLGLTLCCKIFGYSKKERLEFFAGKRSIGLITSCIFHAVFITIKIAPL
jgi:putative flippase GtrA